MKNKLFVGSLLFLSAMSYSQIKFEKGSYISNSKGQRIKLNVKDDNKYEVAVFYGDYEVKNDTIHFKNNYAGQSEFEVSFSPDANPSKGKVIVKIMGDYISYYYASLYIGTQSGKATPSYKNFSEFSKNSELDANELVFEVNREDFFYLAKEEYQGKTDIFKYSLPRNANEIIIQYNPNYLGKMELKGYLDENKQLAIAELGSKMPLTFVPENKIEANKKEFVKPIETKSDANFTFPGKKDYYNDYAIGVDTTTAVYQGSDFKLDIKDNLLKALEATKKTPEKFLVIVYDTNNKNGKAEFQQFVSEKQYEISSYLTYQPEVKVDNYNFYQASEKDKNWLSKNKINDNPSVIVTDGEGAILSKTKGTINKNQSLFTASGQNENQLKVTKAMLDLKKSIDSKAKEKQLLKGFLALSELEILYDENVYETVVAAPAMDTTMVTDYATAYDSTYYDSYSPNKSEFSKPSFDKKKVLNAWEMLVKSHAKDTKPNMDFVTAALAEIKGVGFYRQIFSETRMYDDANFKAIDYLTKHYADIIIEQQKATGAKPDDFVDYYADKPLTLDLDLPTAISNNMLEFSEQATPEYKKRILGVYKNLLEKQNTDYKTKIDYFRLLNSFSSDEQNYVQEYDAFFNAVFKGNANEIQVLDDIYTEKINSGLYDEWMAFKNNFSNASNEAAWFIVEKSKNPESVKKAIKWSESSLRIEKNNPYYLDTLAQLYYKNGEKQKAIATQEQALKYSETMGEETKADLETVLEKMKNGTY